MNKMRLEQYITCPDLPTEGYYDSVSQYWVIREKTEWKEIQGIDFYEIGGPGVDGIGFGYRMHERGIWAYYPNTGDFELKAMTCAELLDGWKSGRIIV